MSVASALARGMLMQRDQLFPTAADAMRCGTSAGAPGSLYPNCARR